MTHNSTRREFIRDVGIGTAALPFILAGVLKAAHVALNFALFALVCVHTAAALKHHFVDRDAALMRMLPRTRPKGSIG